MKRILLSAALSSVMTPVFATPINHPPGSSLTYGGLSNNQTILSSVNNPAASAVILQKENQFGFGIISSVGIGAEIGAVDNIYKEVDTVANDIQNNFADVINNSTVNNVALNIGNEIGKINNLLVKIEDDGYAKGFLSAHVPLMPLVISNNALGGSLVFDANATGGGHFTFLQDSINFDAQAAQTFIDNAQITPPGSPVQTFGDVTVDVSTPSNPQFNIANDSTVILKGSKIYEFSMGYSREIFHLDGASLFAGLRGKYFQAELLKDIQSVENLQGSQQAYNNISVDNAKKSSAFGVDFGLLWAADHYRLGASVTNINGPTFKYNAVTAPASYTNAVIINAINTEETVKLDPQLKLEGALYSMSRNWVIGATVDANAAHDQYNDEYQWANVSAAYATDSWLLPGLRGGYRTNLAGSKLSMLEAGITVFKFFNIDGAYGLQSVQYEGKKYPRTFYINLGVELTF